MSVPMYTTYVCMHVCSYVLSMRHRMMDLQNYAHLLRFQKSNGYDTDQRQHCKSRCLLLCHACIATTRQ